MIDFTEIPSGNTGNGDQDTFELFARDFFKNLGYEIIEEPARGADNGRDLIIGEIFESNLTKQTEVKRWLVSCKHYAHSGNSVTGKDEQDINDRVKTHHCNGFIGFYSTIPNESLKFKLSNVESVIFDKQKIEEFLKKEESLFITFRTYFPKSYKNYLDTGEHFQPIKMFEDFLSQFPKCTSFIYNKTFESDVLYKAFIINDTFEAFIKFLGYNMEVVRFIKDYDKVIRTLGLYGSDRIKKYEENISDKEIIEKIQEIIIDHKIQEKIKVKSMAISHNRRIAIGFYFITDTSIYMNAAEYRYTRNIFNEIKNKYFKR